MWGWTTNKQTKHDNSIVFRCSECTTCSFHGHYVQYNFTMHAYAAFLHTPACHCVYEDEERKKEIKKKRKKERKQSIHKQLRCRPVLPRWPVIDTHVTAVLVLNTPPYLYTGTSSNLTYSLFTYRCLPFYCRSFWCLLPAHSASPATTYRWWRWTETEVCEPRSPSSSWRCSPWPTWPS